MTANPPKPPRFKGALGLGFNPKSHNMKPRATRSNLQPPENPPPTDPVLANLNSLIDIQFKPLFREIYERGRGDYAAFASDFLDVQLHPGQINWVHTHPWTPERHLSSGNRFGKSFVSSIKCLHDAFYQTRPPEFAGMTNDYTAINLSLTIDMARIVTDYALRFALESKLFRKFVVENEIKTAPFPVIPIGTPKSQRGNSFRSEIWARSSAKDARYLLGRKFDFVNYDECARDPHGDKILDEVLRMRLADRQGRLDMTSTAAGRNWFFLAYRRGIEDSEHLHFYSMTGTSYDNPHISHERVRQNEMVMADVWKQQNIYGGFSEYANVFYRPQVEAMYADIQYPICTDYRQLADMPIHDDERYIMAFDWALKNDDTVIYVARVDKDAWKIIGDQRAKINGLPIVYAQTFNFKENKERWSWDELKNIFVLVHKRFNSCQVLFDSTGLAGEVLLQELTNMGMTVHEGYDFAGMGGKNKEQLVIVGQQAVQNRTFVFPFVPETAGLVDQLLMYDLDDKKLPTDKVFGFCLLAECLRRTALPVASLLSLPLVYSLGKRTLGNTLHPFDKDAYEIVRDIATRRVNPLTDDVILSSGGYKEVQA